jgi:hypothetical protein
MEAHVSQGKETTITGVIGDEREIDLAPFAAKPQATRT